MKPRIHYNSQALAFFRLLESHLEGLYREGAGVFLFGGKEWE